MIEQAHIEVEGNKVTVVVVTSTPEEAQAIARTSALNLKITGIEVVVIEEDAK